MKIAVIGWGSLVHSPRGQRPIDHALLLRGAWHSDGPILPLEFSRVSDDGPLTLVVDPTNGAPCSCHHAESAEMMLPQAIEELRLRERMKSGKKIGFVERSASARTPEDRTVSDWLATTDYNAAIWTALQPNFLERRQEPVSVNAAKRYLEGLGNPIRTEAYRYLVEAPDGIDTPLRQMAGWPEAISTHSMTNTDPS